MAVRTHEVRLVLGGGPAALDGGAEFPTSVKHTSLDVTTDMLELADPFAFETPFTAAAWAATKPDTRAEVWIDGARILTGLIDDRDRSLGRDGSTIAVVGRDFGGRLVDESAKFFSFEGLSLEDLVLKVVSPWFLEVTFSNAENRNVMRGRGRKALVSKEPAILQGKDIQKHVEPGETRRGVLEYILREARLLGWSTADGTQFVVGLPNYSQAPQWRFFAAKAGSSRWQEVNVKSYRLREGVQERYSKVAACGASQGNSSNYGPNVRRTYAEAKDNPLTADGTGKDFQHRKVLVVPDSDIKSKAKAKARAEREMAFRNGSGREIEIQAAGFGQPFYGGGYWTGDPAIFCTDTMARVEDEEAEEVGDWLVTRVQYLETKRDGQVSTLRMVPQGTELVAAA